MKGAGFAVGTVLGWCVHLVSVEPAPVDRRSVPISIFQDHELILIRPNDRMDLCPGCLVAEQTQSASRAIVPHEGLALPSDPELQDLHDALVHAAEFGSQTDLTIASGNLANYWEARLLDAEDELLATLPPDGAEALLIAQEAWRRFRTAEIDFLCPWDFNGSLASAIRNEKLTRMTMDRLMSVGAAVATTETR